MGNGLCRPVTSGTDDHCDGTCNFYGTCQHPVAGPCGSAGECQSNNCFDGVCCDVACGDPCRSCNLPGKVGTCSAIVNADDNQCPVGSSCNATGVCAMKNGAACYTGTQCLSGLCVDGNCCDSACTGTCMACNLTGAAGTCTPIPSATADAPMCTGVSTCDGAGACKKADGQTCADPSECGGGSCVRNACCSASYCWPFYAFTATWGTSDYDRIWGLAAANDGGFVVAGSAQTATQSDNIAILRFDATGALKWSKLFGDSGFDVAQGAAVLSDSSVMIGGMFASKSLDLDPGPTTDIVTLGGVKNACFLSKYDDAGNYLWSRTWTTAYDCEVYGVAAAPDDSVYVMSYFEGTIDLDPTAGTDMQTRVAGGPAGFLVKLSKDGAYLWGRLVPMEHFNRPAVAPDGSVVYADGISTPMDLDPTAGVDMRTPVNGDAFVTKLGADGSYQWSRVFAGSGSAYAKDVQVGADGSIVVVGEFTGTATFDPAGTVTKTATDSTDDFITKLDASGALQWTQAVGGAGANDMEAVGFTAAGDVFAAGLYETPFDLDPGPGVVMPAKFGASSNDVWVDGFSSAGAYQWSRLLPGTTTFNVARLARLKDGGLAIGSTFEGGHDFDPGPGVDFHTPVSANDVYVTKLSP
jgi:hypothetical protein